jgi:hypothetical protein
MPAIARSRCVRKAVVSASISAGDLRRSNPGDEAFARAAFEWVRDEVRHSVDAKGATPPGRCAMSSVPWVAD